MSKQKPSLVAIFAHPDDESFGPSGTLHMYTKTHDVYIICATRGDAGENNLKTGELSNLALIREQELRESSAVLGAKEVFFLDYKDGCICNSVYHQIADEVIKILDKIKPEILMTYEYRGVSGHLDHVAMSMITSFVFEKVDYAKTLLYFCLSEEHRKVFDEYFIHVPPGYSPSQIDKVVDITPIWDKKVEAIYKHKSQIKDAENIVKELRMLKTKDECFIVRNK